MNEISFLSLKKKWYMRTKNPITVLLENGIHFSTLTNMSEKQIKVLAERFKKEESKEQWTKKDGAVEYTAPVSALKTGASIPTPPSANMKSTITSDGTTVKLTQAESEITEKFKSKAQQGLFWAKCNNSKGKEKKKWCDMAKEFSDSTTKKEYKKMPEKKHPEKTVDYKKKVQKESYEKFLEDRIVEMVYNHVNPKLTKGEIKKTIQERSESMMLRNPKKMSMFSDESGIEMKKMDKPIGKVFSLGKSHMEENDTKEKERTKEKDTTKKKDGNPFINPNRKVKETTRGLRDEMKENDTKEKERTKEKEPGTKNPPKRRGNPFKNPNPGVKESPRGGNKEDVKMTFMSQIKQALK